MLLYELDELDRIGMMVALSSAERRALQRVRDEVGVEWRSDGSARIYSRGNVGTVALSPETTLRIATKLPIRSVLTLASLAYQTLPIPVPVGDTFLDSSDDVVELLALLLVTATEQLVRYGMRQDYVLVEDALPYVRGRLRFDETREWTRAGLLRCEFSDFLPDTPENRVLRLALDMLDSRRLPARLRGRVDQLLPAFARVAPIQAGAGALDACRINRLNEHYRPALDLARLLIVQCGIDAELRSIGGPAFFFPMEKVFEHAVTNYLVRHFPVHRQAGKSYEPVSGSPHISLNFAADIVIGRPARLVIDTKYAAPTVRNQYGAWSFHNSHVYQVAFYALSLGCPAVLVYPRVDEDIDVTFEVEGVNISILTLDLRTPQLAGFESLRDVITDRALRRERPAA
jgi:5-methylcytosine-specific restriction enzyme subunit McrC